MMNLRNIRWFLYYHFSAPLWYASFGHFYRLDAADILRGWANEDDLYSKLRNLYETP
jgi:hypothetical protein